MAVYITPIKQYIIDAVTAFRIKNNINQSQLAIVLEVERGFVSNVESGGQRATYNFTHLNAIAFYFDVPISTFLPEKALPKEEIPKKSQGQGGKERPDKNNKA